jgi:hypothetical protein
LNEIKEFSNIFTLNKKIHELVKQILKNKFTIKGEKKKFYLNRSKSKLNLFVKNDLGMENSMVPIFQQQILKNFVNLTYDHLILLYKASRDGFDSKDFHFKVKGKNKIIVLMKAKKKSFIFGGYTSSSFNGLEYQYVYSDYSFIFTQILQKNQQNLIVSIQNLVFTITIHLVLVSVVVMTFL